MNVTTIATWEDTIASLLRIGLTEEDAVKALATAASGGSSAGTGWTVRYREIDDGLFRYSGPHAIGYHAEPLDARGRSLPDKVWGWDMPLYADFSDLQAAREYATRVFEDDERVASVHIRQSVQDFQGCSWKVGRGVETITRPEN